MKIYDPRQDGPLQPLAPHGLLEVAMASVLLLVLLVGLCLLAPSWFLDPALPAGDPALAGASTPAWYWLPLLGFFSLLPGGWGLALGVLLVLALAGLPFADKGPRLPLRQRPLLLKVFLLGLCLVLGLFLWGAWRMAG